MRIALLDPPSFTVPYDHALASALARRGHDVTLLTAPFTHGDVPKPEGYRRELHRATQPRQRDGNVGGTAARRTPGSIRRPAWTMSTRDSPATSASAFHESVYYHADMEVHPLDADSAVPPSSSCAPRSPPGPRPATCLPAPGCRPCAR